MKTISPNRPLQKRFAVPIVLGCIIMGYVIIRAFAAGVGVGFLLSGATVSGNASVVAQAGALGGTMIRFGSGGASPTPTPTPAPTPTPTPAPAGSYLSDAFKVWSNGPNPTGDPNFYPIGVWLQNPERTEGGINNAVNYQNIGVNLAMGNYDWPGCGTCSIRTQAYISAHWGAMLDPSAMTEVKNSAAETAFMKGWMIGDEPDMNRVNGETDAYPAAFLATGNGVRAQDSTRPVYANFGKGMAINGWVGYQLGGFGSSGNYATDMSKYCASSDIVSADYYGWTDPYEPANYHGAWTYGKVVDNIHAYCGPNKIAMGFVEASHPYSNAENAAGSTITPDQMEAAIWNVVVHGANGFVYFAHHFNSNGLIAEDAMLQDPNIKARAASVDAAVQSLAAVLNSPSQSGVSVSSTNSIPVTFMYKMYAGSKYIVAQADGNSSHTLSGATTGTFTISGVSSGTATVVGESRTVPISGGQIVDGFAAYGHHVYKF